MKLRFTLLVLLALPLWLSAQTQVRTETLLEKGWKFTREDNAQFKDAQFDDSQWQSVRIPHDWAIYGPFSINNDKQNTAIVQDGQKEAMEHAGRTGDHHLLPVTISPGIGPVRSGGGKGEKQCDSSDSLVEKISRQKRNLGNLEWAAED